jgi:hypothetical protein
MEQQPPQQQQQQQTPMLRPLSAYNYFYRSERDEIVANGIDNPPLFRDFSQARMQEMLQQRWFVDPIKPRRCHRKSHGKVSFRE